MEITGRSIEILEDRTLLASDFGDAPDTVGGTGTDNYQTLLADSGPSHTIVAGLFLGDTVDMEADALPNVGADGDNVNGALPDDEDGVLSPLELLGTEGAAPTVTLLATNTTGSAATLSGWIDYNTDGVFNNATERAQIAVPDGSTDVRFTLTFPTIPDGAAGSTYARFRLSTDAAAANSTGAASDGEVEDHVFVVSAPSSGGVKSEQKISDTEGGFTDTLDDLDFFGNSVASLGDLDGDGVADVVAGAPRDDDGGDHRGAVWILFLNADGTVKSHQKISDTTGGFTGGLNTFDYFGASVTSPGDLDGDGVVDLAVGAPSDNDGAPGTFGPGAVWVLFLNSNGTVKSHQKISATAGGFTGTIENGDWFGDSLTSPGDLDGDGVADLVVGARRDDHGGTDRGAAWVLFLNANGTVKSHQKISDTAGGFTGTLDDDDQFGTALTSLGDLDGDDVADLVVGADQDDDGGTNRGAAWVLFLNADGTVRSHQKISDTAGGFTGTMNDDDDFGVSVASPGDLDGDGVSDLFVGALGDNDGGPGFGGGAVWTLFLNTDGTVKSHGKISATAGGFGGTLENGDLFGSSVAPVGDLNGDGLGDLAVGAYGDDDGGSFRGAVWILHLDGNMDYGDAPDPSAGTGTGNYQTTAADGGPSHIIDYHLFLGATVDAGDGTLQNVAANGDDVSSASDEDGVLSSLDLLGTEGTAPTITLLATNTTGSAATLSGWIDYNTDGVFDNGTERAQIAVPDGSTDVRFTLTFPTIPVGAASSTYARFRLSTDTASANATGAATDGEVEDYVFAISAPSSGGVRFEQKISDTEGGFTGVLDDLDGFGRSVASLGDLDGDGVGDVVVGARDDDDGGTRRGAVWVMFLNADGTVKSHRKISDTEGGFTGGLNTFDYFGTSVTSLGDLDGDGIVDLAVGTPSDNDGAPGTFGPGAVWVLFLNSNGTVKSHQKISATAGGLTGTLENFDFFGDSLTSPGDLDGDGVADLVVGARLDDDGGTDRGAVWVLFLNADGTVKSHQKISDTVGGFMGILDDDDQFGTSLTSPGDLDGDDVADLVVGADQDDDGGTNRGAAWVLFLNSDGTVKSHQKISDTAGGFTGTMNDDDDFGVSVASPGDLDGDGVSDLFVGALGDNDGGPGFGRGAVWTLFLNTDGTVKSHGKISATAGGFGGTLENAGLFGSSVAPVGDLNADGLVYLAVGAYGDDDGGTSRGAVWILHLDGYTDYGDASDPSAGTGTGNYQTTAADNGPSHTIDQRLFLGSTVDAGIGTLQNVAANGDDVDNALPDDEDGVLSPLDLLGTEGTAPTITLLATNTTGSAATLSGWIDYNTDGVFDNGTERAQIAVPDGCTDVRFTLTFPTVPGGAASSTYARFRLSTDATAANSTGAATDGEVEDYVFSITAPTGGTVMSEQKISDTAGGFSGTLNNFDVFGASVASLGDLDGDGVTDVVVGATSDDDGGPGRGAVWVLFLNADGTVKSHQKISDTDGGFTGILDDVDGFGRAVASPGDVDGDGIVDLAVGADQDDDGGTGRGAVWILLLNDDGTVKAHQKISDSDGGFTGTLDDKDEFGGSLASPGDLNGDGVADLIVGAKRDDDGGTDRGAAWVLFLNADGTVKAHQKISTTAGGFTGTLDDSDTFGSSVASPGDLDGDGVVDLAVGADQDDDGGSARGAVWVLLLNTDGTVKSTQKISDTAGGFGGVLDNTDSFGHSLGAPGDLNGDGVGDVVVGAFQDDDGGSNRGAAWILLLNADGTVRSHRKISATEGEFNGTLDNGDNFGRSVAPLGDLDGDGRVDLAVGATGDDDGGTFRGAVWILNLDEPTARGAHVVGRNAATGQWQVARSNGNSFTSSIEGFWSPGVNWENVNSADVNGDGHDDLVGRDPSTGAWWVGLADGFGMFTNQNWGVWASFVNWLDVRIADVNGDGNDDIVGRQQSNGNWWVALSNGVNGFTNQLWGGWTPIPWVDVDIADVNGDGNNDIVARQQNNGNWWVALSNGISGFANQLWGNWAPIPWVDVNIADVNGDGNDDIVARQQSNGNWWVALSNGTNGFANQLWGNWAPIPWADVDIADVNGDGNDDIVARQQSNGNWWVALSNGANGFANQNWGFWSPSVTWVDVRFGDVDGDDSDDIIGREQSNGRWWIGRSNGAGAFSNQLWGTWNPAAVWTDVGILDDLLTI